MVSAFFKRGPAGLDHIVARSVNMLGDARHSFDLATTAVLTATDAETVADDIRATDQRINQAEQDLRSELVVHISVQGTSDIGSVLGFILLLKKIERVGDQTKNILELAEEGVSLHEAEDVKELLAERQVISALFAETSDLLAKDSSELADDYVERVKALSEEQNAKILSYMSSDLPGHQVVPRAIYHRYLKRIVANLLGIVSTAAEPLPSIDYLDE